MNQVSAGRIIIHLEIPRAHLPSIQVTWDELRKGCVCMLLQLWLHFFQVYAGFYHQLHSEPGEDGERVRQDIKEWIEQRMSPMVQNGKIDLSI